MKSLKSVAKSSVRKMSLEEQQEEQKITNHYRVEITEFQEDSQDSEGKKTHFTRKSHLNFRAKTIIENEQF